MSFSNFSRTVAKLKSVFGIRARLIIVALILVVPLMVERVRTLETTRVKHVAEAQGDLTEIAQHAADAQREIMSSVQAVLKSAAYIYSAASFVNRDCAILRASLRVDLPWIRSISVVGKDGRIECATTHQVVGLDLSDRDYYQQAIKRHEFIVSDYIFSRAANLPTIMAAYPISALGGHDQKVILAAIDVAWLSQLMTVRGKTGVSAYLVDSKGIVVATRVDQSALIGKPLREESLLQAIRHRELNLDKPSGSISFQSSNGDRKVVSFARIPDTGARMIASIDESSMLGEIDREIETAYLQLAVVVLLTLLVAWFAGEKLIIRPIGVMTSMATRVGEGDLSARTSDIVLPNEFHPLAKALDVMAAQLCEREGELMASNDRLTVMASVDMVSGLANRRGFQSRLEFEWMKALQTGGSLSLMMIDVDHFKMFNDSYGHPEGDACLYRIGQALSAIAGEFCGFAARYGGEEFCMLLPETDGTAAFKAAERVRAAIASLEIAHVSSPAKIVTISAGVATATPSNPDDQHDLVEAADSALYAAKRRGRNMVVEHMLSCALNVPVPLPLAS